MFTPSLKILGIFINVGFKRNLFFFHYSLLPQFLKINYLKLWINQPWKIQHFIIFVSFHVKKAVGCNLQVMRFKKIKIKIKNYKKVPKQQVMWKFNLGSRDLKYIYIYIYIYIYTYKNCTLILISRKNWMITSLRSVIRRKRTSGEVNRTNLYYKRYHCKLRSYLDLAMVIILDDVASRCDFCVTKLNILKY